MEWQPIETAPKDGTYILVGANLPWIGWRTDQVYWRDDNKMWWYIHGIHHDPTHWIPIPKGPE